MSRHSHGDFLSKSNTMATLTEIEEKELEDVDISELLLAKLVVYNDDVNSFEHVINTFVKILKQSMQQAEQCALIIHTKGRCSVKEGLPDKLKPYKEAICERGIDARIEE